MQWTSRRARPRWSPSPRGRRSLSRLACGSTAPAGTVPLTVKNYLDWCSVSVAGGAFSADGIQVVDVAPGTISLVARPASAAFELAPRMWHHTDGDLGAGDSGAVSAGQSTTAKTVGAAPACVWVCCPFADGTGCAIPDQC